MAESHNEFPTVLGEDAVFKGELRFEKGMKLLGKFEGQMVVAEGAALTGDAKAGTIKIEGQVKGNIHAATKIQLSASARLEGDLQTQRLEVAEGAVLIGRCVVGVNGQGKGGDHKIVTRPVETVAPQKAKSPEPAASMAKK